MRLGDLDALKKALDEQMNFDENCRDSVFDIIDNAPTVPLPDFKEGYKQAIIDGKTNFSRLQGEWIFQYTFLDDNLYKCSSCDRLLSIDVEQDIAQFLFCPNCGADMRRKSNETD